MKQVRVGITGYSGFIGSHLVERLGREKDFSLALIEDDSFKTPAALAAAVKDCEIIVHLAGMNRGAEAAIYQTNVGLAKTLVDVLGKLTAKPFVVFASSTYVTTFPKTAFGRSKKLAGKIILKWAKQSKAKAAVLTIPNVYGDGCRPFYNSALATFCYQLTHGEEPSIRQDRKVEYIYINELTELILALIKKPKNAVKPLRVGGTKFILVSDLLALLRQFKDDYFIKDAVPDLSDQFVRNLYNVFLSYLKTADLKREPKVKSDARGDLFEIIKLHSGGQVFFSATKPGHIRGNHYHTRKFERFCVIKGQAIIRLRKIGSKEITEFKIIACQPTFIEIPIFHAHHIENIGADDLLTLFWCNEIFDPADPDTFFEEVIKA